MTTTTRQSSLAATIAAQPGPLSDSLQGLLRMMPGVDSISHVGDLSSTLGAVAKYRDTLVLLDAGLPGGDVPSLVEQLRAGDPRCRCLVLASSVWQCIEAMAAGADRALLKGTSLGDLAVAIEGMVTRPAV